MCPIMGAELLHDITGVTGQPCWGEEEEEEEEEDLSQRVYFALLRELRIRLDKPAVRRPGTAEETVRARLNLLNSGFCAGHGRSSLA